MLELLTVLWLYIFRWVSVGSDLKYDARRDLDDVGAECVKGSLNGC